MKTKFLLLTILTSIIFFACQKDDPKYHFTEEEKKQALYYSYNVGDTLYFKQDETDTVKLIVNRVSLKEYIKKVLLYDTEHIQIDIDNITIFAEANPEHRDDSSYKFVTIDFFNISGARSTFDTILEELTIDSITYNRVYVYSNTKFTDNKIYANEKYGIIKAENNSTTYTLIP